MRKFNLFLRRGLWALLFLLFSIVGVQSTSAQTQSTDAEIDYALFTTFDVVSQYAEIKLIEIESGQVSYSETETAIRVHFYEGLTDVNSYDNPSILFENVVASTMEYNTAFRNPINLDPMIQETLNDIQ